MRLWGGKNKKAGQPGRKFPPVKGAVGMAESIRTTSPTWSGSSPKASPGCKRPAWHTLDIVAAKCWTGGGIRGGTPLKNWGDEGGKAEKAGGGGGCGRGRRGEYDTSANKRTARGGLP